jgi:hypothetical protein
MHLLGKASLFALLSLPREDLEEQELGSIAAGPLCICTFSYLFSSPPPPITNIFKGPILSPRSEKGPTITLSSYILEDCTFYFLKSLPGATW